ncbi:MAG: hypothetical protein ABSA18_13435 [Dehalococcoidia bacterium]|jgi:hypothetical protein
MSPVYSLDDKILVTWLKANYKDIEFISKKLDYEMHRRTQELQDSIDALEESQDLYKQQEAVPRLWRNLLGKAIVYLKFKDDREEYHDDADYGVERLNKFLAAFHEFEYILYGAGVERYRDHVAHQLSVFLIGEYLIRNTFKFSDISVTEKPTEYENIEKSILSEEKEAMWCIMALTHDLGIPLERITDINPIAEKMLKEFGLINTEGISFPATPQPLDDFVLRLISSDIRKVQKDGEVGYITHLQPKYYMKFSEAYERRDHGVISCSVLLKNLVFFLETDYSLDKDVPLDLQDAKQFLVRSNILRAIASHSNDNIYYVKIPQFRFLLRICDEMHEWGRPRLISMFGGTNLIPKVTINKFTNEEIDYQVVFECTSDKASLSRNEKEKIKKQIRKYFKDKCERIITILRSAVGGKDRKLKLSIMVKNTLNPREIFTIIHSNPQSIQTLKAGKSFQLDDIS